MINESSNAKNLYISSFLFNIKEAVMASFLTVYLLRLNATNMQISLYEMLGAVVCIFTLLFFTVYMHNSRKEFLRYSIIERFGFLFFSIALFLIKNPLIIILAYALYCIPYSIASTINPTYLKDAFSKERWGKVFSKNKMVLISTNVLALTISGILLDKFNNKFPYNFIGLFFIVGSIYCISLLFMKNIWAINGPKQLDKALPTRFHLLRQSDKNLLFLLLVSMPIYMIAPLWAIYHVRVLHFSNFQVGMLTAVSSIGGLFLLPYWGKLLDRVSNKKLFVISALLMAFIPIFYTFNNSYYYLLFCQVIIGVISYGYEVILQNNLMASSKEAEYDYAYMANFQIFQNINRLIFPAVGVFIYSQIGMILTFLLIGFLRFLITFIVWCGMHEQYTSKVEKVQLQE